MWFRWVTDFGLPGLIAHGWKYLISAGYDGPVPQSGYSVSGPAQPK